MTGPATDDAVLIEAEPAITAVMRRVVSLSELPAFFDAAFRTLPAVIAAQEVAIAGPAFALYHRFSPESIDVEAGFATGGEIAADGDVRPSALPGGTVARLVHFGAYDGLGASWGRLMAWIDQRGLTSAAPFWEVYLTKPSPDSDPAELRTELNRPIAR